MNRHHLLFCALVATLATLTAQSEEELPTPGSAPQFDPTRFETVSDIKVLPIPTEGWSVRIPEGDGSKPPDSGLKVEHTNLMLDGKQMPALRLVLTKGKFEKARHGYVELPFSFDADDFNVMSFRAKVEVPEGSLVLGQREMPKTGWFSHHFNRFSDNFGIAVGDDGFDWTALGVPTTHFLYHADRSNPGPDGFLNFQWDLRYDDRSGNKGFDRNNVKNLRLYYNTENLSEGDEVTITIVEPMLISGVRARPMEPELYGDWEKFIENYEPDFSDSSPALEPPATGRLRNPIPLARDGMALAEIVVDLSKGSSIDELVPAERRTLEAEVAAGHETDVLRLAGLEMKRWLDQLTGGEFPLLIEPSKEKRPRIFLGAGWAQEHFASDLEALAADEALDGFAIRSKDGDIYIFGVLPKGTLNGVYSFLENNTDLIWALPNEEYGAVFSLHPNLVAVWGDVLDLPAFVLRGWLTPEPWLRYNRGNFAHRGKLDAATRGDFSQSGGHCLAIHSGRFGREAYARFHPVIDGERIKDWSEYRHLMCLNHPELFDVYMAHWKESLSRPALADLKIFNIGVDDNWGVCECEACSAPIELADGRVITPDDFNEYYSAWFYTFLNRVADELAEWRPGFVTSTYSYFMAAPVPPIELSPNIDRIWLCPYVRKSIKEPLFSPINQHWWQMMKDWHAIRPNVVYRDYYGLFLSIYPIAEVLAADLRAMLDVGVRRITTEGFASPMGDDLGAAEEKWVVTRLYWDPTLDVEELRKYYLRRTFREAAPAMERFRATIRQAWYQQSSFDMDFEENHETAQMIRRLGLEDKLRGYLREALADVKHPTSRILVERTIRAFDAYMQGKAIDPESKPPSQDEGWKEQTREISKTFKQPDNPEMLQELFNTTLDDPGLTSAQKAEIRGIYAGALLRLKKPQAAREQINIVFNDPFLELRMRGSAFQSRFATVVRQDETIDSAEAIAALEAFRSVTRTRDTSRLAQSIAQSFLRRGSADDGARLLEAELVRPLTMKGEQISRQQALREYWKKAVGLNIPSSEAKLASEQNTLLALCKEVMERGLTADEREEARLTLLEENWSAMDATARRKQIDSLVANPWIDWKLRSRAAAKITDNYDLAVSEQDKALADHVLHAITLGDWSGARFKRDEKHKLVCAAAAKLIEAEKKDQALRILAAGSELGYSEGEGDPARRKKLETLTQQATR